MKTRILGPGLTGVAVIGLALACEKGSPTSAPAASRVIGISASEDAPQAAGRFSWDIITVNFATGVVSPGGSASARANDGSQITVTGAGTFDLGDAEDVTGGGTWQTFDAGGASSASGTYQVTALVRFDVAPGTGASPTVRAGLAVLRIAYSDGSRGILVVSCHLTGTPNVVFEGITASRGFTDFWNRLPPVPGVDGNRTVFHVINEEED